MKNSNQNAVPVHGVKLCCSSLRKFLRGLCVECTIITLTIVDIFFITIEFLIRAEVLQDPSDTKIDNSIVSQSPNVTAQNEIDPGGGCRQCDLRTPLGAAYCLAHYVSLIIAIVFFIELLFRLGTGCTKICKDIIQIIDAFTVFNLTAVEVMFTLFWEQTLCFHLGIEAITYIVILRLLRLPRACNVLKEEYSEKMDLEVYYLSKAKHKADERSKELANTIVKQQREIDTLKKQLGSGSLYENDVVVHIRPDDPDSSTISNGHLSTEASLHSVSQNEQSPKYISTIKTDSNIVSMTAPSSDNTDSSVTYDNQNSNKLTRKSSSENKAIYKNVCHVKNPTAEIKRTSSEVNQRVSFESGMDTKKLVKRSRSTKSIKGETIKKAIALLENNKPTIKSSGGGQSISRTPSNKLSDVENAKLQENDSGCVNGSFESDEEVIKRNLPVMAEYGGTRTYRSAEGIPLTDL